jgi:hypothetical protein
MEQTGSNIAYMIISLVYILSFISIYYYKTVLLGVLVLYLINVVASIFISKDIFTSPKVNDNGTILLFIPIVLNIISSTMVCVTLKHLHYKYNKKGEHIKLSKYYTKVISKYFSMFITSIVFSGLLVWFYFSEPSDRPYFDYHFTGMGIDPKIMITKFILKIMLIPINLGLSGYMVFGAHQFTRLRNS